MRLETEDLVLGKAEFSDWEAMYRNVWSREETARYMAWEVTASEEDARERMRRTVLFQETHDAFLVYEKKTGEAIGFAGVGKIGPGIYEEMGIALGPEYVGQGYGKQILGLLLWFCEESLGGREFYYYTRTANRASRALALSCGFTYVRTEQKKEPGSVRSYDMEVYCKRLKGRQEGLSAGGAGRKT